MAERIGVYLTCEGLGDCLFAIPVLKSLLKNWGEPITLDIFTHHPDLFRNSPYVKTASPIGDGTALQLYASSRRVIKMFDTEWCHHQKIDTFDFMSIPLRLGTLDFDEKQLEYFPLEADQAERFDVVLNTSQTWITRSWPHESWQRLADRILEQGHSVAVIGKDSYSQADRLMKTSRPLAGCTDLTNRQSIDQAFHTINRCRLFVSGQNGLSVLAGATDAEIVVLGSSIAWSHRAIYRQGNPMHRITYATGHCDSYCGASGQCRKNGSREQFDCVPGYAAVEQAVMARLSAWKSLTAG
ncbi:glycosyltransferase family 9 protein [Uliginosibacterium sp. TH139]|uniref:glycosyltransferase family 9 protein n=1 Tax=Uliginosibacterium sp. TH139 TaxID=2067453 RepID=UPI0013044AB3|nr:glycosyltransferase family 9 protein [Uliginosibacterium sp. TH139]